VALAQQDKSAWTRTDVIKYLGRVLPRAGRDPAAAAVLLEDLADRALGSEFEPVACLEAPEPAEVPASLRRADGRSVYQRHGGIRYATRAQLVMEERLVAQTRASGALQLTRARAARALGADPAQLDAALAGHAQAIPGTRTQSGLREDQAAAPVSVLTDGRGVSVIDALAGAGKARVATELGRAWAAAGLGPVVGITASQSARNTLAAGVPVSYNAAQFLGHLRGRRGARGPVQTGRRPLLLVDEASTMPSPDLADLVAYANACDGKLILAGDTSQLRAVANGGGMSLLAGALGRLRARLRAGDLQLRKAHHFDSHASRPGRSEDDPQQLITSRVLGATAYLSIRRLQKVSGWC
jgi:AAA domain-containing protein